jgi:hypothetical protein
MKNISKQKRTTLTQRNSTYHIPNLLTRYKKIEEGVDALRSQYSNDVKNMKVINGNTFEMEKGNIQATLSCLQQEVLSKNKQVIFLGKHLVFKE